jgi:hypothetical protein
MWRATNECPTPARHDRDQMTFSSMGMTTTTRHREPGQSIYEPFENPLRWGTTWFGLPLPAVRLAVRLFVHCGRLALCAGGLKVVSTFAATDRSAASTQLTTDRSGASRSSRVLVRAR